MKKKTVVIVGSEGLIGKFLVSKLEKNFNCISFDKKKITKKNYFYSDLTQPDNFKKNLKKISKKNNIFAAINLTYPFKNSNFLQNDMSKFTKYIKSHINTYYNFNKSLYDLFKRTKKNKIIINFSSIYGLKVPNFNIYNGTNIKMPIEYSISKSALIMMVNYFNKWSKFKKKKIRYITISPAGIEDNQSKKFKKNYKKFYKKRMVSLRAVYICVNKVLNSNSNDLTENIILTGGAKI